MDRPMVLGQPEITARTEFGSLLFYELFMWMGLHYACLVDRGSSRSTVTVTMRTRHGHSILYIIIELRV
jgi:hypothetical protein